MVEKTAKKYFVDHDIRKAETLPAEFYISKENFELVLKNVFNQSWQYGTDIVQLAKSPENCFPLTILENTLNEELLLVKNDGQWTLLSNICTHRGFKLVHHPTKNRKINCGYHGRRFGLDGQFEFMPEFEETEDFPRPCDHLKAIAFFIWKRFLFVGLSPKVNAQQLQDVLNERLGFLDMNQWTYAPKYSKTYAIKANWALYVDNYLEGFHIPFVHNDLGSIIDYGQYTTLIEDHVVLQIGYGKTKENAFKLPEGHPDFGKNVTAYYYWIFPNFMLNIYTWGVQINIVKPISTDFCKVEFEYFIDDFEAWERFGMDNLAEKTEREDEFVVEAVQKGLKSQFYKSGRFSPSKEQGVHYFHELLAKYIG